MPHTLALTYNLKPAVPPPGAPEDAYSEFDSAQTVAAIAAALRAHGHHVYPVEASEDLASWFRMHRVDLVFNIAEGTRGEARESGVPALLDGLGIPYTGSGVLALALSLDKAKAKQLFQAAGLLTPGFQLFTRPDQPLAPWLRCPLIVKPNREGSGKGIWRSSVVVERSAVGPQVQRVFERYDQPVLVEEFIEGTELTVGILGNRPPRVLPVLEVDFSTCAGSGERFYSWRMKEFQGNAALHLTPTFWCPARLPPRVTEAVQAAALAAHQALGCRDFSRVDVRLDAQGRPFVLEVNPLAGLDPAESNYPRMARAAGMTYDGLMAELVACVEARTTVSSSVLPTQPAVHAPAAAAGMATMSPVRGGP